MFICILGTFAFTLIFQKYPFLPEERQHFFWKKKMVLQQYQQNA